MKQTAIKIGFVFFTALLVVLNASGHFHVSDEVSIVAVAAQMYQQWEARHTRNRE